MTKKDYIGTGDSLEGALQNLYQNAKSDALDASQFGQVAYDVKLVDKKGTLLGQSKGHPYDHAFLNALKDAGIGPADYNPRNHKLEISVYGSLQAKEEKKPAIVSSYQASGCDSPRNYGTTLTDKF